MSGQKTIPIKNLDLPLNRDLFLRSLIRELSGVLQDVVGMDDASGFVSIVGQNIGTHINGEYKAAMSVDKMTRPEVAAVLENLKLRIHGGFHITEQDDDKLVFGNTECPFGDYVKDRPAMCMMTSNVFGTIASENLGYAKVVIQEAIATNHACCKVIVHLSQSPESENQEGREYFSTGA